MRIALKSVVALCVALAAAPAFPAERCRVTDPTGTPLNVRAQNTNIIGTIKNGRIVIIKRYGEDAAASLGPSSKRRTAIRSDGSIASSLAASKVPHGLDGSVAVRSRPPFPPR